MAYAAHIRDGLEHVLEVAVVLVDNNASDVKSKRPDAEHAELSEAEREALDVGETLDALCGLGQCLVIAVIELLTAPKR